MVTEAPDPTGSRYAGAAVRGNAGRSQRNLQGGCVISSFGNHMRRKLERFALVDPLLDFENASLAAHAMEQLNFLR